MGRNRVRVLLAVTAVAAAVGWSGVAVAAPSQGDSSGSGGASNCFAQPESTGLLPDQDKVGAIGEFEDSHPGTGPKQVCLPADL
jgi:hypothetical protein